MVVYSKIFSEDSIPELMDYVSELFVPAFDVMVDVDESLQVGFVINHHYPIPIMAKVIDGYLILTSFIEIPSDIQLNNEYLQSLIDIFNSIPTIYPYSVVISNGHPSMVMRIKYEGKSAEEISDFVSCFAARILGMSMHLNNRFSGN